MIARITGDADYTDYNNGNIFCSDFSLGVLHYILKSHNMA